MKHLHIPLYPDPQLVSCWQLCKWWIGFPEDTPFFTNLFPSSVNRTLWFWLTLGWLTPYAACLIRSKFSVLKQSCFCWRNGFVHHLLSGKHVKASSTLTAVLFLSYISPTNVYRISRSPSFSMGECSLISTNYSLMKMEEASEQMSQVCQVLFLPVLQRLWYSISVPYRYLLNSSIIN